jgi:hypothetical protein
MIEKQPRPGAPAGHRLEKLDAFKLCTMQVGGNHRCRELAVASSFYRYVTGKKGHTTERRQDLCAYHARVFCRRHGINPVPEFVSPPAQTLPGTSSADAGAAPPAPANLSTTAPANAVASTAGGNR